MGGLDDLRARLLRETGDPALDYLHEQLAAAEAENVALRRRVQELESAGRLAGVRVTEDDGDPA